MKKYYKFLHERNGKIVSDRKDHEWEIGKEYSVQGRIKACANGFHASETIPQALAYVPGSVLAVVEASGDCDNKDDKVCYRTMKIVEAYHWKPEDSIALAIYAAEQVVKIYEDKYPDDTRPRDAIKTAKAYLKEPNKKNADAAYAAARAARAAARAAYAAAYAAYAAAYAADAAARAADAAAYAAARAAAYAAADAETTTKINRWAKAHIKKLEKIG